MIYPAIYLHSPFRYASGFEGNYGCSVSFSRSWWASLYEENIGQDEYFGVESYSFGFETPVTNDGTWVSR